MKTAVIALVLLLTAAQAFAWENQYKNNPQYQQDKYGHHTKQNNMFKDADGDGVINKYDYNDNNRNVQRPQNHNPYSQGNNPYSPNKNPYSQQNNSYLRKY